MKDLVYLLRDFPELTLTSGEKDVYRRFRLRESRLASCMDDDRDVRFFSFFEILTLKYRRTPVGVVSMAPELVAWKSFAIN